jgi:hypothetical protein
MLATETGLLPSLRLLFLDRYRVSGKGWDLLDQVLKKDKAVEKKVRREGRRGSEVCRPVVIWPM